MNRDRKKPPALNRRPNSGLDQNAPPGPVPKRSRRPPAHQSAAHAAKSASLPGAKLSLGSRIGMGIAIGLFAAIGIVLAGIIFVMLTGWRSQTLAARDNVSPTNVQSSSSSIGPTTNQRTDEIADASSSQQRRNHDQVPAPGASTDHGEGTARQSTTNQDKLADPSAKPIGPIASGDDVPAQDSYTQPESQEPSPDLPELVNREAVRWVRVLNNATLSLPVPPTFSTTNPILQLAAPTDEQNKRVSQTPQLPSDLSLELRGVQEVFGDKDAITLHKETVDSDVESPTPRDDQFLSDQSWLVLAQSRHDGESETELARFFVRDNALQFQWIGRGGKSDAGARLKYCLLRLTAGEGTQRPAVAICRLSNPLRLKPVTVDFENPNSTLSLNSFSLTILPTNENLKMDLQILDTQKQVTAECTGVGAGESATLGMTLDGQSDHDQPGIEIVAKLNCEGHPTVEFGAFAYPRRLAGEPLPEGKLKVESTMLRYSKRSREWARLKKERQRKAGERKEIQKQIDELDLRYRNNMITYAQRTKLRMEVTAKLATIDADLAEVDDEIALYELDKEWRQQCIEKLGSRVVAARFYVEFDDQKVVIAESPDYATEVQ